VTLELLTKRVETLYVTDERGRIVSTNEWDARPAPRFHLMLTARGPICRFRGDVPDELASELGSLCGREPLLEPGPTSPALRRELLDVLGAHASVQVVWCGPAYRLPDHVVLNDAAVPIDNENAQVLAPCFSDWLADVPHRRPFVAVVEDGRAVAVCASVRISPSVHCAGVETHPDYRQRGHALRVVASWATAVRRLGATPFYSTSWDNVASQRIAARLGFEMVGVDFHVS
jgi:hypothetical protein